MFGIFGFLYNVCNIFWKWISFVVCFGVSFICFWNSCFNCWIDIVFNVSWLGFCSNLLILFKKLGWICLLSIINFCSKNFFNKVIFFMFVVILVNFFWKNEINLVNIFFGFFIWFMLLVKFCLINKNNDYV